MQAEGSFQSEAAMRHPIKYPLETAKFPLLLAGGLRAAFAHIASAPLPARLMALARRLDADRGRRPQPKLDHEQAKLDHREAASKRRSPIGRRR
jgi:hypothetical protein